MEEVEPIPPLFESSSGILELDNMEEGEDNSTFLTQSRPPSSNAAAAPMDNNLYG